MELNLDVAKRQKWKELVDVYDVFDIQDMARWVLNILVRRKVDLDLTSNVLEDGIETHKLIESIPSWADVKKLVSNVETLPLDEKIQLEFLWEVMNNLSTFSRNANISDSFSSYFKQYFPDSIDFISLMSIRTMNGFGLWDSASECLGHGLYPSASFFNHSCRPNMVRDTGMRAVEHIDRTFHASLIDMGSPLTKSEIISALALQPSVVFTALETMPKNTRLHHSYITLTQKRSARIEELKSGYHFECNCERCGSEWTEEKETEFLETFICKGCSQALIPLEICTRCPNILEVSLLQ
ncbi:hypothetical protein HK098_003281 [Nowakowskiella sp. JEL0407]|nr:hypothetical protein HK098_003281 [Nowakowskiella sp. JEL0407]